MIHLLLNRLGIIQYALQFVNIDCNKLLDNRLSYSFQQKLLINDGSFQISHQHIDIHVENSLQEF